MGSLSIAYQEDVAAAILSKAPACSIRSSSEAHLLLTTSWVPRGEMASDTIEPWPMYTVFTTLSIPLNSYKGVRDLHGIERNVQQQRLVLRRAGPDDHVGLRQHRLSSCGKSPSYQ